MKKLFAVLSILVISACASASLSTSQQDLVAKEFTAAPSNKSNLYIFRDEFIGALVPMKVSLDDQVLGSTSGNTYFFLTVDPGTHKITSDAENLSELEVDLKPGEEYYVWQEVKMGLLFARNKLQLVSEERGQKGVMASKRLNHQVETGMLEK